MKTYNELVEKLLNEPETGMGYQICTVILKDGQVFEFVIFENGEMISKMKFSKDDIADIILTHGKRC